jgi:AraC-like DNA-binding protein
MKSGLGNYKKEGFNGQKAIVLPKSIVNKFCQQNPLISSAYLTDIGYYPKAKFHYRNRPSGAEQNILIYCVEGKGQISIDRKTYGISPGDFFIIPQGTSHAYETDLINPWTIYWCHFKGTQSDEIIKQIYLKNGSFKSSIPFTDLRIEMFNTLYRNLENGYSFENLSYVNLMLPQYLSSFLFADKFYSSLELESEDPVEKSILYMQNHVDSCLTLEMLAASANSSCSHFSAVFKKRTGFPPIEYFNHLKIQKACQYLQFTELRIKEIANKVGIEDQYYFSRLFAKIMGFSPTIYKQQRNVGK